jgi:TrmH family RNA methyltransferase
VAAKNLRVLTAARDLKRRKARERNALFVVEGIRATEELLRSNLVVRGVLYTSALEDGERGRRLIEQLRERAAETLLVEDAEMDSAAQTESPQGVLAVAEIPQHSLEQLEFGTPGRVRVLLMDAIQDPGNAGTLLRTAAAFGVAACIALPGTVDLWSAKVVRSAMGAQFNLPAVQASMGEVADLIQRRDFVLWGAEAGAAAPGGASGAHDRLILAVGNEGAGLSADVRQQMSRAVGVVTRAEVESLNVSVAAGILLHELCQ